jgi:hypothetical protein
MFVVPFRVSATEFSIFILLQDENLERMKIYDPAEVTVDQIVIGSDFHGLSVKDIILGYGTNDDLITATEMISQGKHRQALQFLSRGFKYRPEAGDAGPIVNLTRTK